MQCIIDVHCLIRECVLQVVRQVLEAHASMLNLSVQDAKLQYIRNWQALQDFGIVYFLVKQGRSKREVSGLIKHTHSVSTLYGCVCYSRATYVYHSLRLHSHWCVVYGNSLYTRAPPSPLETLTPSLEVE